MAAPQYTDTCPAFNHLKSTFRRIEQAAIDQDWPALPRSMRFPALSNANVGSVITHPHPVIWVGSEFLYAVAIRCPCRHSDEFLDRDYLDIPFYLEEVKVSVVAQESDVICVVVEELLKDIIRPPKRGDQGVLTKAFEVHAVLSARHRQVAEVGKVHVVHRRPKDLKDWRPMLEMIMLMLAALEKACRAGRAPEPSADPCERFWDRVRDLIEEWFSRLCSDAQADVRGRLHSRDDRQSKGAFFEVVPARVPSPNGLRRTCHPEADGTSRRPDFLREKDGSAVYVEARSASLSDVVVGAVARVNTPYESLDKIDSPNLFLWIGVERQGSDSLRACPPRSMLEKQSQGSTVVGTSR